MGFRTKYVLPIKFAGSREGSALVLLYTRGNTMRGLNQGLYGSSLTIFNRVITIQLPHSMINYSDVSGNTVENTNLLP